MHGQRKRSSPLARTSHCLTRPVVFWIVCRVPFLPLRTSRASVSKANVSTDRRVRNMHRRQGVPLFAALTLCSGHGTHLEGDELLVGITPEPAVPFLANVQREARAARVPLVFAELIFRLLAVNHAH